MLVQLTQQNQENDYSENANELNDNLAGESVEKECNEGEEYALTEIDDVELNEEVPEEICHCHTEEKQEEGKYVQSNTKHLRKPHENLETNNTPGNKKRLVSTF